MHRRIRAIMDPEVLFMRIPPTQDEIKDAISHFEIDGPIAHITRCEIGHINDSYALDDAYFLQRLSSAAFPHPEQVMANVEKVTDALHASLKEEGENEFLHSLTLVPTKEGKRFYFDKKGECWRMYLFVPGYVYNSPKNNAMFLEAGRAFGEFQNRLQHFDASSLYEVIPHFHDTPKRYRDFLDAKKKAIPSRLVSCQNEIAFLEERSNRLSLVVDGLKSGKLPLRITHNDTKLNNIMFDETDKALCVLDLDTVMPGSSLYDFGDAIRFGANLGKEDETDLKNVSFSLERFEAYARGYLLGASGALTKEEAKLFPYAGFLMTIECGMRFLADYLVGDVYFSTAYPEHNLIRAKDQFALIADMEKKQKQAEDIMDKLIKEFGL